MRNKIINTKTTFSDIVGYQDEVRELKIILESLKLLKKGDNAINYHPKGLLLEGDPGMGKTLFAKVFISEAKLPTFIIDGTSLSSSVGKACRRINQIFRQAKKQKNAIIFIDEINRIVPKEGMFNSYESDLSRSVLSCLLTNLDGIETNANIFVLMTSNDSSVIDPALIRPGRIDKIVSFQYPVLKERQAIVEYYIHKNSVFRGMKINTELIAKRTEGASCSHLKTLVSEVAVILSSKMSPTKTADNIFFDRIIYATGMHRTNQDDEIPEDSINRICYHELGHALAYYELNKNWTDVVINPAGSADGGGATFIQEDDQKDVFTTKKSVLDDVVVTIAGRAAEEYFLKEVTNGCSSDISQILNSLHAAFGSGLFGFDLIDTNNCTALTEDTPESVRISRHKKIKKILKLSNSKALEIMEKYSEFIKYMMPKLKAKKILSSEDLEQEYKVFSQERKNLTNNK